MKADAERAGGLERVWRYSILPLLVEHHYGRLLSAQVHSRYGLAALRGDLPTPAAGLPDGGPAGKEPAADDTSAGAG